MGKSTISMAIFNSYFDITRGYQCSFFMRNLMINPYTKPNQWVRTVSLVLIGNMSSKHNGYRLSMSLSSQKLDVWITKPWWHHAMLKQGNITSSLGFAWKQDSIHRLIMSPHQNCYNWVVNHFQRPTGPLMQSAPLGSTFEHEEGYQFGYPLQGTHES